jgi:hypothetical protein
LAQENDKMNIKALQKARAAFARAQKSLLNLKQSNDFPTIEEHWEGFLDDANRVFTRLEQASKGSTKTQAWWGKHVHEWKKDPLLQYIRQARDATHHSIQEIAQPNPGRATPITDPSSEELAQVHKGAQKVGLPYTLLGGFEVVWPHIEVLDVVNRGMTFPRPTSHLGKPVAITTPAGIGDLALDYLGNMIREAESFT